MRPSYNRECHSLALHFLENGTDEQIGDLAIHIRGCVKDWLQNVEFEKEQARQSAADRACGL